MSKHGAPKVGALGYGRMGSGFVPGAWADSVYGNFDPDRLGHQELKLGNGHGATDVSPSQAQSLADSIGKPPEEARPKVFGGMTERAGHVLSLKGAGEGVVAVASDSTDILVGPLDALKHDHPAVDVVVLCAPPQAEGAGTNHAGCLTAKLRRSVTAVGHYSAASPFAQKNSPFRQDQHVILAHNALAQATRSYPTNPAITTVHENIGRWGPCFQFGFASLPLALGEKRRVWEWLRKPTGGQFTAADGNLDDALSKAARATELACNASAFTTTAAFDPARKHYVVYVVPFHPRAERFREFAERQSVWLANHSNSEGVYVSGNGLPLLGANGERFLEVVILAPIAA